MIDACIALIDNPELEFSALLKLIPGPDFPTAASINGQKGIVDAYKTGRGRAVIRAKTHIETDEKSGKDSIIITELPYQVNKARLIERIAELVKEKKIEGITELRDESDKEGMRVVIELRRGENTELLQNQLYSQTQMQSVFGINMVALVDGRPRTLSLREILQEFVRHRREVVTRRSVFELRKARERAHILEGLGVALANIDDVVQTIRTSKTPTEAKERLLSKVWSEGAMLAALFKAVGSDIARPDELPSYFGPQSQGYRLSPEQAQAILDLRLHRLTGLEQDKISEEYQTLVEEIRGLLDILSNPARLLHVIREELLREKEQFSQPRRTVILENELEINSEDLSTKKILL